MTVDFLTLSLPMLPMLPILLLGILAFYVAANLGANDVANSMGTSVGSKALTLRQALIVAGILEFTGAVIFGHEVAETLATQVVNTRFFVGQPEVLLLGMVSVMVACGLWLQIATSWGLPVSSSHGVVGALAGFSWVAAGFQAVDWQTIGVISVTWLVTPLVSGAIAAGFYGVVKYSILDRAAPMQQLQEWTPWLSAALFGIFGAIALPTVTAPVNHWIGDEFGVILPPQDLPLLLGTFAAVTVTVMIWRSAEAGKNIDNNIDHNLDNNLKKDGKNASANRWLVEKQLAKFQVISACFVAFAHGSNDVGNAIAPLAAISYILRTGEIPGANFQIPVWILILGGTGIVTGLAIWGKNVITTVGEKIISLQPSGGFCAELATATTVLIASRLGLPVSTSHALVGGVVGIGLVQNFRSIRLETMRSIILAWLTTVPFSAGLAAAIFWLLNWLIY
ncbi:MULTISPECIES: inorganic phosphate transporter [Planktothricoides]|uniref:Phosphate transporter n=2 Tax=Planktothricoides raciborskii TaxID=132608 RepID=A0AAU8J9U9_9CYAN|nr:MULTISPECIES: inorganic phosphate transporter [Planktothricoides]